MAASIVALDIFLFKEFIQGFSVVFCLLVEVNACQPPQRCSVCLGFLKGPVALQLLPSAKCRVTSLFMELEVLG